MWFYRVLLRLYPSAFRQEYGEEMCHVFSDRLRSASGWFAFVGLWHEAFSDVVVNAARTQWDVFRQDLRYTTRTLVRAPGFALSVVVVTALGIGASTAVFSIADRVLIRPLPFAAADRLVKLWEHVPPYNRMELSPANYRDWRRMSSVFESMAAFHGESLNLVGRGDPRQLRGAKVTADLFPTLGVEPAQGRYLTASDFREGAPEALVLSYGAWQGVFGGRTDILGTSARLDDTVYTVVGIMPRTFFFPDRDTEFWTAKRLTSQDFEDRDNNYLRVIAKLAPRVSLDEARAEMDVVTEQLERAYPAANAETRATVIFLRDEVSQQARLLLIALVGASLGLLLIACTNLANLMLARGMERRKELTVRTALGGGRERLVRHLLTESVVLAVVGGALGLVIGTGAIPILSKLIPTTLPLGEAGAVDARVLLFAVVLTGLTAMGFGVLPAARSAAGIDTDELREGSRAGTGGRRQRLRGALVVAQVTASVALLVVGGLLIQALWRVRDVDPGFRDAGVLALNTPLPWSKYRNTARRAAFYNEVLTEVRALPVVSGAAYVSFLPMVMRGGIWPVEVSGAVERPGHSKSASLRFVTPGFFSTMGIPLTRGRDVSDDDTPDTADVAVVSESFACRYWPSEDPLGRRFRFAFRERIVAGVVGDVRVRGLERTSEPQVYIPYRQVPDGSFVFYTPKEMVIRSTGDTGALLSATRQILRRTDPDLPIAAARTLEDVVSAQTDARATQVGVLGAFAGLSLLLSGVGIYGLLSFAVSRRRSELGLRIALGARSGDILGMVIREGLLLAVVGSVLGTGLAYSCGRAMEALLFGVAPADTASYASALGLVLLMTAAGSLLPALRALRVDPTETMRAE